MPLPCGVFLFPCLPGSFTLLSPADLLPNFHIIRVLTLGHTLSQLATLQTSWYTCT